MTKQVTKTYQLVREAHPHVNRHQLVKIIHRIFVTARNHHYKLRKLDLPEELQHMFGNSITAEEMNKILSKHDPEKDIENIEKLFNKHFPHHAQRQESSKKARKAE